MFCRSRQNDFIYGKRFVYHHFSLAIDPNSFLSLNGFLFVSILSNITACWAYPITHKTLFIRRFFSYLAMLQILALFSTGVRISFDELTLFQIIISFNLILSLFLVKFTFLHWMYYITLDCNQLVHLGWVSQTVSPHRMYSLFNLPSLLLLKSMVFYLLNEYDLTSSNFWLCSVGISIFCIA